MDFDALMKVAEHAANAGADIVRANFGRARDVRAKGPGDWVSEADLASESAVREILDRESSFPVRGEEAGGAVDDTGWLVDPLDGTANFVHGFDAVGVSVGLIQNGVPILGVVVAPMLGRTYAAAHGLGARRNGEPIRASSRDPERAIVATGFPFRHKEQLARYEPVMVRALRRFEDLRRAGAASLDLCWTAEGVFDGYFELSLGPWDVAAGALILREAGGVVTDWEGDDRAWLRTGNILAAPPKVHETLLEIASSTN